MNLQEIYQSLDEKPIFPRLDFRKKIMDAVGCSEATAYRYLSGATIPNKPTREAISKVLEIPITELFPKCDNNQ